MLAAWPGRLQRGLTGTLAPAFALGVLGLALAAFFVIPAVFESSLVQLNRIHANASYDYNNNFLPLATLLNGPEPFDPKLIQGYPKYFVGFVPAGLALLGLVSCWSPALDDRRRHVVFGALGCIMCVLLASPFSKPLWDVVPAMQNLQFPYRWLALNSLFLAVLMGAGLGSLTGLSSHAWITFVTTIASITLIAAYSVPLMFLPSRLPLDFATNAVEITRLEREYGVLGTTNTGEYLPIGVSTIPPVEWSPQSRGFRVLNPASLVAGVRIVTERYDPLSYDVTYVATAESNAEFDTFFFPGWQAQIDGQPSIVMVDNPYGVIHLILPAGTHRVTIGFGDTLIRTLANAISVLAMGLWIFLFVRAGRRLFSEPDYAVGPGTGLSNGLSSGNMVALSVMALCAFLFTCKTLILDVHETPFRYTRFDGSNVAGVLHPANVNFDNHLVFMGADFSNDFGAGASFEMAAYWRSQLNGTVQDISVAYQLLDDHGNLIAQQTRQHPADTPSHLWKTQQYARDLVTIPVPNGTLPGEYVIRISAYPYDAFTTPLPTRDTNGGITGIYFDIGKLRIVRGRVAGSSPDISGTIQRTNRPEEVISLVGFELSTKTARTGDHIPITLYWRANQAPRLDMTYRFIALGPGGDTTFLPAELLSPKFPTSQWRPGDVWRIPVEFLIPANMEGADYRWNLQVDGLTISELAPIHVESPAHVFVSPETVLPITKQSATFPGLADLQGYAISGTAKAGSAVDISLVWLANEETAVSYKVFVHLLDSNGNVLAADDRVPADWSRPTTSWVKMEYVIDKHTINIPPNSQPGSYTIETGFYEAMSGSRLALLDNSTAVRLMSPISVLP